MRPYSTAAPRGCDTLRSANFTVRLTGSVPASAAETALTLEARAPRIAVAIRPRGPLERVIVFMVISWGCPSISSAWQGRPTRFEVIARQTGGAEEIEPVVSWKS